MKPIQIYEVYQDEEYLMTGSKKEISERLDITFTTISKWIKEGKEGYIFTHIGGREQAYEYYQNDELMLVGTFKDIINFSKKDEPYLSYIRRRSYNYPTSPTRIIKLEGEHAISKPIGYFEEEENMIQMKSFKGKHAPKTVKERKEQIQVYKTKPVAPVEWKPSEYSKHLFDQCFKGWS